MSTAIHFTDTLNMRAMMGSIALHLLIGGWLLSGVVPVEITSQHMIKVTMIPESTAKIIKQKSEILPQEKRQSKKLVQPVKEALPPKESVHTMVRREVTQATPSSTDTLASLSPSVSNTASPKASTELVTTPPLFDPAYLNNPVPKYPAGAKRRGIEGSVMLGVVVRHDGTAKSVTIAESSGFAMLDESAQDAVSHWKFVPARKGNETVEARVMVPIDFRLE